VYLGKNAEYCMLVVGRQHGRWPLGLPAE
jgi:hypothetical protein